MLKEHMNLVRVLLLLILLLLTGIIGYTFLLHLNFIDALYMTVITISTVGYREIGTMSTAAKLFSIFMIFSGLGFVGYTFTTLVTFLTEGELKKVWRKRKMDNQIAARRARMSSLSSRPARSRLSLLIFGKRRFVTCTNGASWRFSATRLMRLCLNKLVCAGPKG
jgi:hypothetical protein